jgi:hypothetical protein
MRVLLLATRSQLATSGTVHESDPEWVGLSHYKGYANEE